MQADSSRESQVTGMDLACLAATHIATHPTVPQPAPAGASHTGHCARPSSPRSSRQGHASPRLLSPPHEDRSEGCWLVWRGPVQGTGTGTSNQTGQPSRGGREGGLGEEVAKATGSRRTNQSLPSSALIFRSWAWTGWAGRGPDSPGLLEGTDSSLKPLVGFVHTLPATHPSFLLLGLLPAAAPPAPCQTPGWGHSPPSHSAAC